MLSDRLQYSCCKARWRSCWLRCGLKLLGADYLCTTHKRHQGSHHCSTHGTTTTSEDSSSPTASCSASWNVLLVRALRNLSMGPGCHACHAIPQLGEVPAGCLCRGKA